MTVNAIRLELSLSEECPPPTLTQDHLIFDPLHVLRCDLRVFRYDTFHYNLTSDISVDLRVRKEIPLNSAFGNLEND